MLGFTAQLRCVSCKELAKYNLSKIEPDCFDCCEADDAYKVVKLFHARSYIFSAFIEGQERQKYGNLRLTYKAGHRPTINLLTAADELEESHVIETWDSDTILEFLDQRLAL
ncbi:hypothetical protein X801_10199 [Opisthorchis viverrini]|uniref:Selenoprotein F n=1 Tax=Opisthorchis viverrini TaxID=6198 RepID=A0A1S8WIA3_OPIVI|nr:hypothetical protein X801_10199 [Opisthorchis viverrini]